MSLVTDRSKDSIFNIGVSGLSYLYLFCERHN